MNKTAIEWTIFLCIFLPCAMWIGATIARLAVEAAVYEVDRAAAHVQMIEPEVLREVRR